MIARDARKEYIAEFGRARAEYDNEEITDGERYNRMVNAAARAGQPIAKPSGEVQELPIFGDPASGYSPLEYFFLAQQERRKRVVTEHLGQRALELAPKVTRAIGDIRVTEKDCGARGVWRGVDQPSRLLGRATADGVLDRERLTRAELEQQTHVSVRSVLRCETTGGVCARCCGQDASVGDRVGARAALMIAEAAAKMRERMYLGDGFRWCPGVATAKVSGFVRYVDAEVRPYGDRFVLANSGAMLALFADNGLVDPVALPIGATLFFADGERVAAGDRLAEWDPWRIALLADLPGGALARARLIDPHGVVRETVDEVTGLSVRWVACAVDPETAPSIELLFQDDSRRMLKLRPYARIMVRDGTIVRDGDVLASGPRELGSREDFDVGIERFIALLDADPPRFSAPLARKSGIVRRLSKRALSIDGALHRLDPADHVCVADGERVRAGDKLQDGERDPRAVLAILGVDAARAMIEEVIWIHLATATGEAGSLESELVARAMTDYVRVRDAGGSAHLTGTIVHRAALDPRATAEPILLGLSELAARACCAPSKP